jgi:hypothetical protein
MKLRLKDAFTVSNFYTGVAVTSAAFMGSNLNDGNLIFAAISGAVTVVSLMNAAKERRSERFYNAISRGDSLAEALRYN